MCGGCQAQYVVLRRYVGSLERHGHCGQYGHYGQYGQDVDPVHNVHVVHNVHLVHAHGDKVLTVPVAPRHLIDGGRDRNIFFFVRSVI